MAHVGPSLEQGPQAVTTGWRSFDGVVRGSSAHTGRDRRCATRSAGTTLRPRSWRHSAWKTRAQRTTMTSSRTPFRVPTARPSDPRNTTSRRRDRPPMRQGLTSNPVVSGRQSGRRPQPLWPLRAASGKVPRQSRLLAALPASAAGGRRVVWALPLERAQTEISTSRSISSRAARSQRWEESTLSPSSRTYFFLASGWDRSQRSI